METTAVLLKRAAKGDADAACRLGYRHAFGRGRGTRDDWRIAAKFWKDAAKAEHPRAAFFLGNCYGDGSGVGQSLKMAMCWYRKAADQGHDQAQYVNLGNLRKRHTSENLHLTT